jgi:RHS repeat-associated protein
MGNTIHTTYDPFGNPDGLLRYSPENRTIPASRRSWSYGHPETPGRLYRAFEPEPGNDTRDIYTQYGYDLAGNIDTVTDPIGNTVRYAFDRHNRITEIIHPDGSTQQFGYDSHGNLHTVTDGNRQVTTFEHDDRGRRISETSADTGTSRFEYDVAGNLTRSVDARGVEITYAYDALGRIETIDSPPLDGLPPASITYRYDQGPGGIGQLTGMADASGTTTWDYSRYHDQGIVTKTSTVNGLEQVVTTTRSPGGRIRRLTYPSGRTVDYHRSACACAVSDVTTTMDGITTPLLSNIAYRPFGRPTALGIGASDVANIDNHYDAAGRLTVSNPGTPNARRYTYDASGNPTSIEITSIPLTNQTIAYDSLNRITSHLGLLGRTAYEYDSAGNRAAKTANSDRDTYTYAEGSNQLDHIQSQNGDQTAFTYDTSGNTTSAGNRTYTYDQYNRLVTVHDNQEPIAAYTYNGLNQRVTKTTSEGTTTYLYDMDGKLIAETDPANTATQGQEYLYNGNIPIAQTNPQTDTLHHIHTNYLGAVHQLTDPSATIAWEALYTPFGQAIPNASATTTTPWRLPGQYHDQETGLHYNHHRYYDPTTGRYLTPDPIGLTGGPNRYTYANNNPMTRIDPQGLTDDFVKALTGQDSTTFISNGLEVDALRVHQFNENSERRKRDYKLIVEITQRHADIMQNIRDMIESIPFSDAGPIDLFVWLTARIIDSELINLRKSEKMHREQYIEYLKIPDKIAQFDVYSSLNYPNSCE